MCGLAGIFAYSTSAPPVVEAELVRMLCTDLIFSTALKERIFDNIHLKGGLLGLGHIDKGTSEIGNPEYEYVDQYIKRGSWNLLMLDLWIISRGIIVICKGGRH